VVDLRACAPPDRACRDGGDGNAGDARSYCGWGACTELGAGLICVVCALAAGSAGTARWVLCKNQEEERQIVWYAVCVEDPVS
jgi:hypothetical protein